VCLKALLEQTVSTLTAGSVRIGRGG